MSTVMQLNPAKPDGPTTRTIIKSDKQITIDTIGTESWLRSSYSGSDDFEGYDTFNGESVYTASS